MKTLMLAVLAASVYGQPKIENAKLQTRAVTGSLDAAFRAIVSSASEPTWIGYSVAQAPGEHSMCGTVSLEGARELVVLYRGAAGQAEQSRTYAIDCTLDAGDLPRYWRAGVDGSQSAALLASFIPAADLKEKKGLPWQLANSALSAIARHRDGAAALIELARRPQISPQIKQEAVRWLGRSMDPRAIKFFEEILVAR